jgi:putative ABC transport system permease protein
MYRSEERLSEIISSFTLLGLLVASLGLFGLAAFITEQRKKEIGVRKVFGASVPSVVRLLSKEFLTLVAFANVIAWPLAYYLMHSWLKDFAYRVSLGIGYFVVAGVTAVLVALVTVSYQSIRAAQANPIDALRYE